MLAEVWWGLSATAWTAIQAVTGIGVVLGTAALAIATWRLASQTSRDVRASEQTVLEIRRDRELAFRPYLSWEARPALHASNNGRGPALNAVFCHLAIDSDDWLSHLPSLLDLGPGDEVPSAAYSVMLDPMTLAAPPRIQMPGYVVQKIAICEDLFGNRYRFVQGQTEADRWIPGSGSKPDWVEWYEATAPVTRLPAAALPPKDTVHGIRRLVLQLRDHVAVRSQRQADR